MQRANALSKLLSILIIAAMVLSGMSLPWAGGTQKAYAKLIENKNEDQKQACDNVTHSYAPDGYDKVIGNSVFRGGDSYSHAGSSVYDNDITDFADPLPYGNTFVDTSKLNWNTPSNFIIDIQDDRFVWATSEEDKEYVDALGHTSTNDPMGQEKPLQPVIENEGKPNEKIRTTRGIFYVGPLQSYHNDIKASADNDGYTNVIEPKDGADADYLYRITYLNAVTLPNGTRGNLVLTMKKVQIETPVTIDEDHPYTLTAKDGTEYSYKNAIMLVQRENELGNDTGYSFQDSEGNKINQQNTVVMTKEDAATHLDEINSNLPAGNSNQIPADWADTDKYIRNAMGNLLDLDIEVTDAEGNSVNGTISYAAHDMDFESAQTVWGRPLGDEFSEGITIVSGSQSYALVPEYNHLNAITRDNVLDDDGNIISVGGWLPVGPGRDPLDSALSIKGPETGNNADGIRFASAFLLNMRAENGLFDNAIYARNGQMVTYQGDGLSANNNIIVNKYPDAGNNSITNSRSATNAANDAKKQLYAILNKEGKLPAGVTSWKDITPEMAWEGLGSNYWKTYRNDDNQSFDSGFAVLLDAKKSSIQWSGSRATGSNLHTRLFDSSIFTYVEKTHGTGGGIYLERYDISNKCKPVMDEGTVTMARYGDTTVTAVPEKGYRVNRILIGDTNYGLEPGSSGLNIFKEYVIDGNDIKIPGQTLHFEGSETVDGFPELKTGIIELPGFYFDVNGNKVDDPDKKIVIERNADGTVDVTLPYIDNPMHVHADFGADYYFYKVWVDGDPVPLNMTAAPAGVYPTKVTLPVSTGRVDADGKIITQNVEFEINGSKYTAQSGTYHIDADNSMDLKGLVFNLTPNNTIEYVEKDSEGEETIGIRPAVILKGEEFVHETTNPETGETEIDARYTITTESRVADWEGPDAKNFTLQTEPAMYKKYIKEYAENDEGNPSPGNKVWLVKYPSEGVDGLSWPALPVEQEPVNDNHDAINHHQRNYWFVVEDVPNWSTEGYSNENADIPGKADPYYKESIWYANTSADYATGEKFIHEEYKEGNAFMSVFKNGGEITNVPSIIVRGKKIWDDKDNDFKLRKDIWLHIDSEVTNSGGSVTTKKDVLPAQKVAANASGNGLIKQWGAKERYATGVSNVVVRENVLAVPSNAKYQPDGSYKLGNTTYWVNELKKNDEFGNVYRYSIRETLDREGNQPVGKDSSEGLLGYTCKDTADWDELSANKEDGAFAGKDKATISGQEVDRYNGEVKNTLDTVDFTVTKIWDDAREQHGDADINTLKEAFTLYESDKVPATGNVKLQPKDAEPYVKNGDIETGTLETVNEEGKDTTTFTWHNVPKYMAAADGTIHEAVYSVKETPLENYEAPVYSNEDKALNKGTITNKQNPPTPEDDETWGLRGEPQTGEPKFEKGTADIEKIQLIDPKTGKPTDENTVDALDENGKKIGTYTLKDDGSVIFQPDEAFVGDPKPAMLRATDKNGFTADAEYQPHVIDNVEKKTVKRKINYLYDDGTPVLDDEGNPLVVEQEVEYTRKATKLDPDTHEPIFEDDWTTSDKMDEVVSPDIEGWETDTHKVDEVTPPHDTEPGSLDRTIIYKKRPPVPHNAETWGGRGEEQTGTPTFDKGTAEIVTIKLIDPETGEPTDKPTVVALDEEGNPIGTYTLNEDGTVTFQPNDDYVGTPKPVQLRATDKNGDSVDATYQPHVVDNEQTDTVKKTITHVYDDGTPVLGSDGKPLVTEYELTFTRTGKVDPKTGEVTWDAWEEQTFDDWDSPEVEGYTPHKDGSKGETVTPDDGDKNDEIVYKRDTFTVTYLNGSNGKSDGKGNETGVPYGDMVKGGNTVTPDSGYKFTGKYTYTITKKDGTVETGETDDPTSVKVTGDVVFTPLYKKLPQVTYIDPATGRTIKGWTPFNDDGTEPKAPKDPTREGYTFDGWDREVDKDGNVIYKAKWKPWKYTIKYDANGGKGKMSDQKFTSDDGSAVSKQNEFTRDGYKFTGFKAKDAKGNYLKDKDGNELFFNDTKDFMEYLKKLGPDSEITLEAQWKKLPTTIYVDPATGRIIQKTLPFLDENTEPDPPADPTRKGYNFVGWDRIEEYDENGELVNVRYEAKWEKIESEGNGNGSGKSSKRVKTGDSSANLLLSSTILLSALLAALLMIKRRRCGNR